MKELLYNPKVLREVLRRERERRCQKVGLGTKTMIPPKTAKATKNER